MHTLYRHDSMLKQRHEIQPVLTPPLFAFASLCYIGSSLLTNKHGCLLISAANSKTISTVAKAVQCMIYIPSWYEKQVGWAEELSWLSYLTSENLYHVPTQLSPCAPSCLSFSSHSPDRHSDSTKWWRRRHGFWRDININLSLLTKPPIFTKFPWCCS